MCGAGSVLLGRRGRVLLMDLSVSGRKDKPTEHEDCWGLDGVVGFTEEISRQNIKLNIMLALCGERSVEVRVARSWW